MPKMRLGSSTSTLSPILSVRLSSAPHGVQSSHTKAELIIIYDALNYYRFLVTGGRIPPI